jgi:hypothetical protein
MESRSKRKWGWANLLAFTFNPVEYSLKSAFRKPTFLTSFLIILVSRAQPFRPKVEGVSEWLMDAGQDIPAGHENLSQRPVSYWREQLRKNWEQTLSKAVLHALGCVATNIGLVDIVFESSNGREWKETMLSKCKF